MNPFELKGTYTWNIPGISRDPVVFAAKVKAAGFQSIYLKVADGKVPFKCSATAFPGWGENVRQAFVDALHAVGIAVIGWGFLYGDDATEEGRIGAQQCLKYGLDGYIFDVESRFDGWANRMQKAWAVCDTFDRTAPTIPTGLCWWSKWHSPSTGAQWHPKDVAVEFMKHCDYGLPMNYWYTGDLANTDAAHAARALWEIDVSTQQWREITPKPLIPTGRSVSGDGGIPRPASVLAFDDKVRALGHGGISWWVLDGALKTPDIMAALTATEPFGTPVEPPPPVEETLMLSYIEVDVDGVLWENPEPWSLRKKT